MGKKEALAKYVNDNPKATSKEISRAMAAYTAAQIAARNNGGENKYSSSRGSKKSARENTTAFEDAKALAEDNHLLKSMNELIAGHARTAAAIDRKDKKTASGKDVNDMTSEELKAERERLNKEIGASAFSKISDIASGAMRGTLDNIASGGKKSNRLAAKDKTAGAIDKAFDIYSSIVGGGKGTSLGFTKGLTDIVSGKKPDGTSALDYLYDSAVAGGRTGTAAKSKQLSAIPDKLKKVTGVDESRMSKKERDLLARYKAVESAITPAVTREREEERAQKTAEYEKVTQNKDFAELSAKGMAISDDEYKPLQGDSLAAQAANLLKVAKFDKEVNNPAVYAQRHAAELISDTDYNDFGGKAQKKGILNAEYLYMSDNEVAVYSYYLEKDGRKKADEYFETLRPELEARRAEKQYENESQWAQDHPGAASGLSVLTGLGQAGSYLNTKLASYTDPDAPANPNNALGRASRLTSALREGAAQGFKENGAVSNFLRSQGMSDQKVAQLNDFLYGTGMSMADCAAQAAIFGPEVTLYVMSAEAAGQSAQQAAEQGINARDAAAMAEVAGAAEYVTEKLPLDNLFKLTQGGGKLLSRETLKAVLKQAGTEGTEELVSSYMDTLADIAINGENSQYETYIAECMAQGMSREQAEEAAKYDFFFLQPMQDAAGGAVSGLGFGVGGSAIGDVRTRMYGAGLDANTVAQQALATGDQGLMSQAAELQNAEKASAIDKGSLAIQTQQFIESLPEQQKTAVMLRYMQTTGEKLSAVQQTALNYLTGQPVSQTELLKIRDGNSKDRQGFEQLTGTSLNNNASVISAQAKADARRNAQNAQTIEQGAEMLSQLDQAEIEEQAQAQIQAEAEQATALQSIVDTGGRNISNKAQRALDSANAAFSRLGIRANIDAESTAGINKQAADILGAYVSSSGNKYSAIAKYAEDSGKTVEDIIRAALNNGAVDIGGRAGAQLAELTGLKKGKQTGASTEIKWKASKGSTHTSSEKTAQPSKKPASEPKNAKYDAVTDELLHSAEREKITIDKSVRGTTQHIDINRWLLDRRGDENYNELRKKVRRVSALADIFGLRLSFSDGVYNYYEGKQQYSRDYQGVRIGDDIYLSVKTLENAEMSILGHEIGHIIAGNNNGKLLTEFHDLCVDYFRRTDNTEKLNEALNEIYNENVISEGEYGLFEEYFADRVGDLFGSEDFIKYAVGEKPSLMRRISNAIRQILSKLRGRKYAAETDYLRKTQAMILTALQEQRISAENKAPSFGSYLDSEITGRKRPEAKRRTLPGSMVRAAEKASAEAKSLRGRYQVRSEQRADFNAWKGASNEINDTAASVTKRLPNNENSRYGYHEITAYGGRKFNIFAVDPEKQIEQNARNKKKYRDNVNAARDIAGAFGYKIGFFAGGATNYDKSAKSEIKWTSDSFVGSDGTIWINLDSKQPYSSIVGSVFWKQLQTENPNAAKEIRRQLQRIKTMDPRLMWNASNGVITADENADLNETAGQLVNAQLTTMKTAGRTAASLDTTAPGRPGKLQRHVSGTAAALLMNPSELLRSLSDTNPSLAAQLKRESPSIGRQLIESVGDALAKTENAKQTRAADALRKAQARLLYEFSKQSETAAQSYDADQEQNGAQKKTNLRTVYAPDGTNFKGTNNATEIPGHDDTYTVKELKKALDNWLLTMRQLGELAKVYDIEYDQSNTSPEELADLIDERAIPYNVAERGNNEHDEEILNTPSRREKLIEDLNNERLSRKQLINLAGNIGLDSDMVQDNLLSSRLAAIYSRIGQKNLEGKTMTAENLAYYINAGLTFELPSHDPLWNNYIKRHSNGPDTDEDIRELIAIRDNYDLPPDYDIIDGSMLNDYLEDWNMPKDDNLEDLLDETNEEDYDDIEKDGETYGIRSEEKTARNQSGKDSAYDGRGMAATSKTENPELSGQRGLYRRSGPRRSYPQRSREFIKEYKAKGYRIVNHGKSFIAYKETNPQNYTSSSRAAINKENSLTEIPGVKVIITDGAIFSNDGNITTEGGEAVTFKNTVMIRNGTKLNIFEIMSHEKCHIAQLRGADAGFTDYVCDHFDPSTERGKAIMEDIGIDNLEDEHSRRELAAYINGWMHHDPSLFIDAFPLITYYDLIRKKSAMTRALESSKPLSLRNSGKYNIYNVNSLRTPTGTALRTPTDTEIRSYADEYSDHYGAIEEGERVNSRGDQNVPRRVNDDTKVRQTARTLMEAENFTPQQYASDLLRDVVNGTLSYTPISNQAALDYANGRLANGYDRAMEDWHAVTVGTKTAGKNQIALGERLIQETIKRGDTRAFERLVIELCAIATRAGQAVQAISMIKRLSPQGQLMSVHRQVNNINNTITQQTRNNTPIAVNEELEQRYMETASQLADALEEIRRLREQLQNGETRTENGGHIEDRLDELDQSKKRMQDDLEKQMNDIVYDCAKQLPRTIGDMLSAWRYLAMLGNPRTHVRNLVGNFFFAPAVMTKNIIGGLVEDALGDRVEERTKTVFRRTTQAQREYAQTDARIMKDMLQGSGKYNPAQDSITDAQKENPFGNKTFIGRGLNKASNFVGNALETEDWWFLRPHYVHALSNYMAANKLTPNDLDTDESKLNKAREYAVREAQKATYRDANAIADFLSDASRKAKSKSWIAHTLLEGVVPFKKTPANIVKRGLEYSPAGLIGAITKGARDLHRGTITGAEFIDRLSTGMTGTAIVGLGAFLASVGIARGGRRDDDDLYYFEKMQGAQDYSLVFGDTSYTVDWMAPVSMPFFVGVELYRAARGDWDNATVTDFLNSLSAITEPIFNLSMLDGLSDTFKSYASEGYMYEIAINAFDSYVGQMVPTMGGQIARIIDPVKRNAYYNDKTSGAPKWAQSLLHKNMQKIPGLSQLLPEKIDAWGRIQRDDSLLVRILQNTISPGYLKTRNITEVDAMLQELYEETGNDRILPSTAKTYIGEYNLSAEEYVTYAQAKGQTAYNLINSMRKSAEWKSADSDDKVEWINDAYNYADSLAKSKIKNSGYKMDQKGETKWYAKAKSSGNVAKYIMHGEKRKQNKK